jgi:hypothetical protein
MHSTSISAMLGNIVGNYFQEVLSVDCHHVALNFFGELEMRHFEGDF